MIPHTQEKLFLSNVSYFDKRKEICLDFTNCEKKISKCHVFFPSFHLKGISSETLEEMLSSFSSNSFKLLQENDAVKVVANRFSTLVELHIFLEKELNKKILLLSPERQFLILNNLSYFDSFTLQNAELTRLNDFSFPETTTKFSLEPLQDVFSQLKEFDKPAAKKFLNTLIFSNILKTPFEETPLSLNLQFETFLENLLFKHSLEVHSDAKKVLSFREPFNKKKFSNAIELDFSPVLSNLLIEKNISFDSFNCDCCKPVSLYDSNVLPSSLVKVRFLEEGFYFDSQFRWFSEKFHLMHKNKSLRIRRKNEFFLNTFPVGPFFSGETAQIPLADALLLRENNSIELFNENRLQWHCLKKRAPLAEELSSLVTTSARIKKSLALFEKNLVRQHNLQAFSLLENDLSYEFRKNYCINCLQLFNFSFSYLTNPSNKYFSSQLSEYLLSLKSLVLQHLKDFVEEKGARYIGEYSEKVFLQNIKSFDLNEFLAQATNSYRS